MMFPAGRYSRDDGGLSARAFVNEKLPSPTRRILFVGVNGMYAGLEMGFPFPFAAVGGFLDMWLACSAAWIASCFFFSRDCWEVRDALRDVFFPLAILA